MQIRPSYFNPFALSLAGRPYSFWSVILHEGRRSGKPYRTPVVAARADERFIIPLPYGRHVDWFQNVMAAGGCRVVTGGQVYQAAEPQLLPFDEGVSAFPGWVQPLLRRSDTQSFLGLTQVTAGTADEAAYQRLTAAYPLWRGLLTLAAFVLLLVGAIRALARLRSGARS